VHLHAQHHYSPAIILSRIPFLLTSWGIEVLTLPDENIFIKTSSKMAAMKASKVTVDANCLKDIWTRMGIPKDKIEVIPFGVNLKVFNPKIDGSETRQKLQIPDDDIVLISTRALHNHHYNVESFIRAIPAILKSCSNVKFIVKGTGPLENYLRNLTVKLGVSEHVRFVGLVPHHQVAEYLAAADIYVSTCLADTTSVSLLEAMACGLAPVVTDTIGNRAWVSDGENGFLFPPENAAALAEKTIQLIENEELLKRFGERCHRIVEQRASWDNCVARMERIYQSLL